MGVPPCTGAQSSSINQYNCVPQLRQVRCAAHAHEHDSRSSCTVAGHSAYHCRDAPFNEQLLRPGADVSRCVAHHSPLFRLRVRLTSRFTCIWCLFLQPYASGQRCSDRPMEEQRRQEKQERFAPVALAHLHIIHSNTATASKGSSSKKSSIAGTPVLKDPKKINKNAKQLQKVRPLSRQCLVAIAASSAFDF